jgi:hypothetical protein
LTTKELEDGTVVTHLNATCPKRLCIICPSVIKALMKAVFCEDMPFHDTVRGLLGLDHGMHVDHNLMFVCVLWCEPRTLEPHPYHRDVERKGEEVEVFIYPDVST